MERELGGFYVVIERGVVVVELGSMGGRRGCVLVVINARMGNAWEAHELKPLRNAAGAVGSRLCGS